MFVKTGRQEDYVIAFCTSVQAPRYCEPSFNVHLSIFTPTMAESPVAEPAMAQETALVSEEQSEQQQQLEPVKKTKKIIRKKRRPARVQVDPSEIKSEQPPQTGDLFNIWYSKW